MKWQQYFLRSDQELKSILEDVPPAWALEFGVGDGAVTRPLLEAGWHVHGWEIDNTLKMPAHPNLELAVGTMHGDFTKVNYDFLDRGWREGKQWWVISAPPYDHLPFIKALIEEWKLPFILLIPDGDEKDYRPLDETVRVLGMNFEPPSSMAHRWVKRGPQ